MTTSKENGFLVIDSKELNDALRRLISTYKGKEKDFLEQGVNIEDIKSIIESLKGKSVFTIVTIALTLIDALPINVLLKFIDALQPIQNAKILRALYRREINFKEINLNSTGNNTNK